MLVHVKDSEYFFVEIDEIATEMGTISYNTFLCNVNIALKSWENCTDVKLKVEDVMSNRAEYTYACHFESHIFIKIQSNTGDNLLGYVTDQLKYLHYNSECVICCVTLPRMAENHPLLVTRIMTFMQCN